MCVQNSSMDAPPVWILELPLRNLELRGDKLCRMLPRKVCPTWQRDAIHIAGLLAMPRPLMLCCCSCWLVLYRLGRRCLPRLDCSGHAQCWFALAWILCIMRYSQVASLRNNRRASASPCFSARLKGSRRG